MTTNMLRSEYFDVNWDCPGAGRRAAHLWRGIPRLAMAPRSRLVIFKFFMQTILRLVILYVCAHLL